MKPKTACFSLACFLSGGVSVHPAPAIGVTWAPAAALATAVANPRIVDRGPASRLTSMMTMSGRAGCYGSTSATGAAAAQVLLPLIRQGVDGTTDQVVNASLPGGFRVFGAISGGDVSRASISALGSDGTVYVGQIDPSPSNYVVAVKADTYKLRVCFGLQFTTTFNDPASITVTADTQHDVTLPAVTAWTVTGKVAGDSAFGSSLAFASSDNASGGSAPVGFDGGYTAKLPNGTYTVGLTQLVLPGPGSFTLVVGTAVVSDADVMMDFTAPPTNRLSGTVTMADGSRLPDNSFVSATDSSAPPGSGFCVSSVAASGFAVIDSSTGRYQDSLATGSSFNVFATLLTNPAPDIGTLLYKSGLVTISGDTAWDIAVEAQPGSVTFSGQVVDPDGAGVPDVAVFATTQQVTAAPNSTFSRSTKTDTSGNFSFAVENGSNYTVVFDPSRQMP